MEFIRADTLGPKTHVATPRVPQGIKIQKELLSGGDIFLVLLHLLLSYFFFNLVPWFFHLHRHKVLTKWSYIFLESLQYPWSTLGTLGEAYRAPWDHRTAAWRREKTDKIALDKEQGLRLKF